MKYLPETFYFDQADFPFKKAVTVTAKEVGVWCGYCRAQILSPKKGGQCEERFGPIPQENKEAFIESTINWIFENSETEDLFALFLDISPIPQLNDPGFSCPKFCHHDDTCCWNLELNDEELNRLQLKWKEAGLPEDLFYPEDKAVHITKELGPIARAVAVFGGSMSLEKIYTPKQWQEEQKRGKS